MEDDTSSLVSRRSGKKLPQLVAAFAGRQIELPQIGAEKLKITRQQGSNFKSLLSSASLGWFTHGGAYTWTSPALPHISGLRILISTYYGAD